MKTKKIKSEKTKIEYREYKVTDTHDTSYRGTPKETRKKLDIGSIYLNAAICKLCNWFIRSRNRHDMVFCSCGKVAVDGGSWYLKRLGNPEYYTDIIELYDDESKESAACLH